MNLGVMKTAEYDDSVLFRVMCDCQDSGHDLHVELEYDNKFGTVDLHFYPELKWADYYNSCNFFKRMYHRVKYCARVLLFGEIELYSDMIFTKEEHIDNFIKALEVSRDKLKERHG